MQILVWIGWIGWIGFCYYFYQFWILLEDDFEVFVQFSTIDQNGSRPISTGNHVVLYGQCFDELA
ncbi:MAG: hypothetical protein EBZ76_13720 [Synechococcaceae bacterium WB9_2_170]|nr:hypothetical protein [Synechococcaceae bacterium WB9_2_170]